MAHIRNEEFYLYTGLTANGNECFEAYKVLSETGINFRHLHYGDPRQHEEVIGNIKTWFPGMAAEIAMPFVIYTELYEFSDPIPRVPKIVLGLDEIKNTNWVELFNFTAAN